MSKVNVIIKDKNTLVLTEDAKSGDIIDLTNINLVDLSTIEEQIEKNKDILYNKKFSEYKESLNKDLNSKINEINKNHELELNLLKKDLENLNSNINLKVENEKIKFANELELYKQTKNVEIKELELKYNKLIDELKLNHLKEIEEKNNKIHEKEEAFVALQRQRASLNVKQTGEDLESWCNNEVISYMQNGLLNCTWEKDNTNIKEEGESKASKADYIFKIYSSNEHNMEDLLTSVCLEMKDENPDSTNKKTNADYFKQLDKNRNKKQCKYALLVSNLENEKANDLPIYRVNQYPDMYVVRPGYMMIFLNLITSLTMRFVDLIMLDKNEKIELKSTIELMEEFDILKNRYLDKPLEQLKINLEKIKKDSDNIRKAVNHIDETINTITNSYLNEIENKLNRFEINTNKLTKKIK